MCGAHPVSNGMKLIGGFIFHIAANVIAFFAANALVAGFSFTGTFAELIVAATILTAINTFVRPILKLFFGPLIALTLGLFIIVINALALYLLDIWSPQLTIQGYEALFWATLLFGAVNFVMNLAARWVYRK